MVAVASKRHHQDPDATDTSKARFVRRGPVGSGRVPLRSLREGAGLTQEQVGKAIGMAQGDVSKLEKEKSFDGRSVGTLRKYLGTFGCDVELAAIGKAGHRFVVVGSGELAELPPAKILNADEAIKVRAHAAAQPFKLASEALSDTLRMAAAAGGAWAEKAEVLRKLALVTETVRKLADNVTGELIGMGPTPTADLALLDAMTTQVTRELRKPRSSSSSIALREHPIKKADLVRDLRAVGLSALPLSDWYSGAEDASHPLKYGAPPSGKRRVTWLAEVGWLTGPIEGLVLHVVPMMRKHGHLLGKQPPADLKERLTSELEGVRARRAKDEKKDVDSYLLAVFRAYGFKNERCSGWLKTRPR